MIFHILATLSAAVSASALPDPQQGERQVVQFPTTYVTPIQAALREFKKTHVNWKCFRIIVLPQSDNPRVLQVGFSSDPTAISDPKSGTLTVGPPWKCGPGATYLVGLDGTVLQQVGHVPRSH